MRRVTEVRVLDGHRLALVFDDGVSGTVDLSPMAGKGVFASWRDPAAFARVRIGSSGELAWDSGGDLCPDALYLEVTGQRPEHLFPALRPEPVRA